MFGDFLLQWFLDAIKDEPLIDLAGVHSHLGSTISKVGGLQRGPSRGFCEGVCRGVCQGVCGGACPGVSVKGFVDGFVAGSGKEFAEGSV